MDSLQKLPEKGEGLNCSEKPIKINAGILLTHVVRITPEVVDGVLTTGSRTVDEAYKGLITIGGTEKEPLYFASKTGELLDQYNGLPISQFIKETISSFRD